MSAGADSVSKTVSLAERGILWGAARDGIVNSENQGSSGPNEASSTPLIHTSK